MKVSQSCTELILDLNMNATQTNINTILSDILIKDSGNDVYIIAQEDITDLNIAATLDSIRGKDESKALIILVDNKHRNKLLEEIRKIGAKQVYELNKQEASLMEEDLKVILNKHSAALSNLNITKNIDTTDMEQVSLSEVSLPFSYRPGHMSIEKDYEGYIKDSMDPEMDADIREGVEAEDNTTEEQSSLERELNAPKTATAMVNQIKKSVEDLDFEQLKKDLDINSVIRNLEMENAGYKSLRQTINALDAEMNNIIVNPTITKDQRLEKLIDLLRAKREQRTAAESREAAQFYHISDMLLEAVDEKVNKIISLVENKYASKELEEIYKNNVANIQDKLNEKYKEQEALNSVILSLSKTLGEYDNLKANIIDKFYQEGLTESEIVNAALRADIGGNRSENVRELIQGVITKAMSTEQDFTATSKRIEDVVKSMYKIQKINEDIISGMSFTNKILVANRVEETVVINNPVKAALRLFVGASNVGKTATAHILAKLQARKTNACVLDLTQKSNLSKYTSVYNLSEIINNDIIPENDYIGIVQDEVTSSMQGIENILEKLAKHYKFIILLIEDNDRETYDYFIDKAISVNFVVDDTDNSVNKLKPLTDNLVLSNTAIQVMNMYTDLTPIELCDMYGLDVTRCKIINIPRMNEIRRASREGRDPALNDDVKVAFQNLL